jgi:hypothetical protein
MVYELLVLLGVLQLAHYVGFPKAALSCLALVQALH